MITGKTVQMRPIAAEDVAELRRIHLTPEVSAFWGEMAEGFPDDEPESTRFTILHEGRVAGLIQYGEEEEPDFRRAWIDIFVDPALHGRGVGTEAVRVLMRHLIDVRGHHRITIDPALENGAAIRSYTKAGFKPVGVCHAAWRNPAGEWRDELYMEYVELPGDVHGAA
jgi:aminoglycoside 6'-N-acetyltransferase